MKVSQLIEQIEKALIERTRLDRRSNSEEPYVTFDGFYITKDGKKHDFDSMDDFARWATKQRGKGADKDTYALDKIDMSDAETNIINPKLMQAFIVKMTDTAGRNMAVNSVRGKSPDPSFVIHGGYPDVEYDDLPRGVRFDSITVDLDGKKIKVLTDFVVKLAY